MSRRFTRYTTSILCILFSICISCQTDKKDQTDTASTDSTTLTDSASSSDSASGSDSDSATGDSASGTDSATATDSDPVPLDPAALTEGVAEIFLIDDMDDGNTVNALNGAWLTYDDRHDGGESVVWPESLVFDGVFEASAPGFGDTGFAARITGTTGDILSWDYLGMITLMHPEARCPNAHPVEMDLSQYDGIQFVAKGTHTPGTLVLKIPHGKDGPENNCNVWDFAVDSLTRYGDYEFDFASQLSEDWTLIRIPFTDFAQPSWAPQVYFADVLATLKELTWEYKVPNGEIDLWIDNVAFYKALPDPTDIYPRAVIESDAANLLDPWFEPVTIGTATEVAVEGQPFTTATHMQITEEATMLWDALLYGENTTNIKREDILHADFYARCITPPAEGLPCNATFVFQDAEDPFTQSAVYPIEAGSEWTHFSWPFRSKKAYDPAEAAIMFFHGYAPQTIEIGGFTLTNHGQTQAFDSLAKTDFSYGGRAPDAPWRAAAEARIDTHRKGDLSIVVQGADGAPIVGAEIAMEQTSHDFGFGTAINAYDVKDNLSGTDYDQYTSSIPELFNTVVLENALKWPQLDGLMGERIGLPAAQWALDWAEARNLAVRGHTLVWPGWNNLPSRLKREYDDEVATNGEAAAATWLEAEIEAHITSTLTNFKGQLVHWDVLNEPFDNHDLIDILGPDAVVKWFETARAADPDAKLFVNDYSVLARKTNISATKANLFNTVAALIDAGAPVDGIGFQSHFDAVLTPPEKVYEILEEFAVFDKPLWVSEFDLPKIDPILAGDYTRDFMTILFSHPAAGGFMMWGFWDGNHFGGSAPIYDMLWNEKPSGAAYRDLVFNQWHTSETGVTAEDGGFTARAFYGDYNITVTIDGTPTTQTVSFPKGTTESIVVQF